MTMTDARMMQLLNIMALTAEKDEQHAALTHAIAALSGRGDAVKATAFNCPENGPILRIETYFLHEGEKKKHTDFLRLQFEAQAVRLAASLSHPAPVDSVLLAAKVSGALIEDGWATGGTLDEFFDDVLAAVQAALAAMAKGNT